MQERNKIYFASDFHLGAPNKEDSLIREKKICRWLDSIKDNAKEIYFKAGQRDVVRFVNILKKRSED